MTRVLVNNLPSSSSTPTSLDGEDERKQEKKTKQKKQEVKVSQDNLANQPNF